MHKSFVALSSFVIATGCASDPTDTNTNPTGAGGSSSGDTSSGGSGGSSSGGSASSGGASSGTGGSSNPAGGAIGGGSGGMNSGSGGMDASGGAPVVSEPKPSPGCTNGNPNATIANSLIDVPNGYDGSTPLPLVVALHANGNQNTQLQGHFGGEGKSRGYLLVYPKSAGGGWSFPGDKDRIDAAYDGMLQNFCVDENRVFGIGHSGGAQTLTQMLCQGDDRLRAVAPIAASRYCAGWDAVAAIVIHGICDQERGGSDQSPNCPLSGNPTDAFPDKYNVMDVDGAKDFAVHKSSNMCSDESAPFTPGGNCGANIDPGCVEYQGCSARTQFCNHNDPEYGGTNHGIPCFATQAIFDFFDAEK